MYTYHSVIHLQQITFVSVLEDAVITRRARQYRGVLAAIETASVADGLQT